MSNPTSLSTVLSDSEEEEIREFLLLERTFEQEHAQSQPSIDPIIDLMSRQTLNDSTAPKSDTETNSLTSQTTTSLKPSPESNDPGASFRPNADQIDLDQYAEVYDNDEDEDDENGNDDDVRLPSSLMSENSFWTKTLNNLNATDNTLPDHDDGDQLTCRPTYNKSQPLQQVRFDSSVEDSSCRSISCTTHPQQRPLTIYLPNPDEQLDLIAHVQTLGHDLALLAPHVRLRSDQCCGYLYKQKASSVHSWQKRYFHFDRATKRLCYFRCETECRKLKKPNVEIRFEHIENVYVDHGRNAGKAMAVKSARPVDRLKRLQLRLRSRNAHRHVFVVKTHERDLILSTFVPELMRVWIDVIFTGAQAYLEF